jgi:C-terminal processing protease CtpA/Prc
MKSHSKKQLILVTLMAFLVLVGAQQLFADGKPWIGIYMQDVTPDLAEAFDLSVSKGVVINDVAAKSPADNAGLKPKDVVLTWNGKTVANSEELTQLVGNSNVGDNVKLSVNRGGKNMDLSLEVGERKEPVYSFHGDNPGSGTMRKYMEAFKTVGIGVSMQSLSGKLGEYFGVPDGEGALITEVMKDTPAEKAGLKVGDVIVQVDKEKVPSPSDVSSIIHEKQKGDKVDLVVVRDKAEKTITLEVDEIESYGSADPSGMYMQYFNQGNQQGHNPALWFQDMPKNDDTQRKMDELQSKLDEMQRKLYQLERKMK